MKFTPLRLLITHLLGLAVGGSLYVTTTSESAENTSRPTARTTHRTTALDPENINRALTRKIQTHLEKAKKWDALSERDKSIRQLGLEAIRLQPQVDRENQAELRRWILSTPSQWEKIAQLPSQKLRDIAYTAVISDVDYYKESAEWVIGKIVDPLYREAAEKILRMNAEAGEDPFGDRIDPFDPFKE